MVRSLHELALKHSFSGTLNKVGLYRDVLHFYNHECSLPFVYGISGLFGFSFFPVINNVGLDRNKELNNDLFPDYKLPPFYTSGNYFFGLNNALRATNVWCQRGAKTDKSEFIELLKAYIGEGRPILIDVEQTKWFELSKMATITSNDCSLGFIDYEKYLLNSTYKTGDYGIICIGYDDQKAIFQMLDTHTLQVVSIGFDELFSCTNQHDTYCSPANKWYVFYVPPELPEKKKMVSFSILNTVNLMANPFKTDNSLFYGIKGLEYFSAELESLFKTFGRESLNKTISYLLYSSCSLNFVHDYNRLVFSEFLIEAGTILNNSKLEKVGGIYVDLSNSWSKFFSIISNIDCSNENTNSSTFSFLNEIVEKEKNAIQLLQKTI